MSEELYHRVQFLIQLPIVISNFFTILIMRRRLNNKFGSHMLKGVNRFVITYVIMFGIASALLPEQIYYSFADINDYKLNFRISQLFDSVFESVFLYFCCVLKNVEISIQVRDTPVELVKEKLKRQQVLSFTLMLIYIFIRVNDVVILLAGGDDVGSKTIHVIQQGHIGLNVFFF